MQDYYQLDQQNIFFLYKIKGLYAGLSFSSFFHLFVSLHFYLPIFLFYKSHVCCLFQALCKLGFICPLCYLYLALPPQISVYVCSSVFPCLKYTSILLFGNYQVICKDIYPHPFLSRHAQKFKSIFSSCHLL